MVIQNHSVSPLKLQEVERIKTLVDQFNVVGLARIEKVPAKALHNLRETLRGDVVITMSKKKLIRRAFANSGKENLVEFSDQITGISALLFTNMNPIKLAQFLESKAVKGPAKPGDIAPADIMVKGGDTKIAPGPIISELNQHLKVPTMIKNGTIHIRSDSITHHTGDLISEKQAQLLGRLGLEPMTIKLDFYSAWEGGEILAEEVLHMDIEAILNNVRLAASQAMNLALGLGMITEDTVVPLIQKAARSAVGLAMELPMYFPELLDQYMAKATRQATVLNAAALGLELTQPATSEPKSSKKEEKPEEKEEDDEPTGLGSLFG
ncbi:MAG: 50S ribosomal protein L10 [Promethearchaeota archaeon]